MTRFFRQYSRLFMLLFMSVLTVVFVIGDAIGRGSSARADALDVERGTAFGQPVRDSHIRRASADLRMAATIGLVPTPLARPELISQDNTEQNIGTYLLMAEAENVGIRISEGELQTALQQMGVSDQMFRQLAQGGGRLSSKQVYEGLGRVMAVEVLFQAQADAGFGQPLPEIEDMYRNFNQNAQVKVSIIDAKAFLPEEEPTDAQLQALFDEGKDRSDEASDEEYKFGYELPARVKLEWITLDPKKIEDDVTIREADAERYYRNNLNRYRQAAGGPGEAAIVRPYEDVREEVRATVRSLKAIETARRQINLIRETVARPWRGAPLNEDGIRQAPPEGERIDLASAISDSQYADLIVRQETGWLTRDEVSTLPLLGGARMIVDNRRIAAPQVAFNVDGLAERTDEDPTPWLWVGEPGPVLTTFDTRATGTSEPFQPVAFRVLEVQSSGPPSDVSEVREKLVEDWGKTEALARAGEHAQELAEQARSIGLDQAVADAEALRTALQSADAKAVSTDGTALDVYAKRLEVTQPPRFNRFATMIDGVRSTPLHEKIFELEGDDRVVAVAVPDSQVWMVAELVEVEPLYQAQFDQQKAQLEQRSQSFQRFRFAQLWCNFENLSARTGFVRSETDEDIEEDADAEVDEAAQASQ